MSLSSGSTLLTRPMRSASTRVDEIAGPQHFQRPRHADEARQEPGAAVAGDEPDLDVGSAMRALSAAKRMSPISAMSSPAPVATPLIATI